MFRKVWVISFSLLSLILTAQVWAQGTSALEPQTVQVTARDGLILIGHYYALPSGQVPEQGAPAILLLHGHNGSYLDWKPLLEPLLKAGYHALAVEERSMGATGGKADWLAAIGDVQSWLDWLKAQSHVHAGSIGIVGARIGAHLAINGCSNEPACFAVVALSPGCVRSTAANCSDGYKQIPGLKAISEMTAAAVAAPTAPPIFIAVSQGNPGFADSAKTLAGLSQREFSLWFYTQSYSSVAQLLQNKRLTSRIIEWLQEHALTAS